MSPSEVSIPKYIPNKMQEMYAFRKDNELQKDFLNLVCAGTQLLNNQWALLISYRDKKSKELQ